MPESQQMYPERFIPQPTVQGELEQIHLYPDQNRYSVAALVEKNEHYKVLLMDPEGNVRQQASIDLILRALATEITLRRQGK